MSTVRVEVLAPFKVAVNGQVWRPGEVAEVDEVIAGRWQRYGYVTVVEVLPEPESEEPPAKSEPDGKRTHKQPDEPSSED